MFRGEAVVDAHHGETRAARVAGTGRVEEPDLTEDECSAVEIHEPWADGVAGRSIDAYGNFGGSIRPRDPTIGDGDALGQKRAGCPTRGELGHRGPRRSK